MAIIDIKRTVSLDGAIMPVALEGTLYGGENQAHRFIINATKDGAALNLSGAVTASFLRKADDAEVPLTGEIIGGGAAVTLAQSCYTQPGRFELTIFLTQNGSKTALYSCNGNVRNTSASEIVDPGHVVPDVSDIVAEYERMQAASEAAEAAAENANEAAKMDAHDAYINSDMQVLGRTYQTLRPGSFELLQTGALLDVISGNEAQAHIVPNGDGWNVYKYDFGQTMMIRLNDVERNLNGVLLAAAMITDGNTTTYWSMDEQRKDDFFLADAIVMNVHSTSGPAANGICITSTAHRDFEDVIVCADHVGEFDNIVAFGDSIFAGDGLSAGQGVVAQFASMMGLPIVNYAVGGATLTTRQSTYKNIVKQVQDYRDSFAPGEKPSGTPLYILDGGTNDPIVRGTSSFYDVCHYNVNMGQYGTDDTLTIYGAIKSCINDLLGLGIQPWQIVVTTPIPKGIRATNAWGFTEWNSAQYVEALNAVITAVGYAMYEVGVAQMCNVINGYRSIFGNLDAPESRLLMMTDDIHPTQYGAKHYAERIFTLLGRATQREVTSLKSAMDDNGLAQLIEDGWITGKRWFIPAVGSSDAGREGTVAAWQYVKIPCTAGDKFVVTASATSGYKPWGFFDSENHSLLREESSVTVTNKLITAPNGTAYLAINQDENRGRCYRGEYVGTQIERIMSWYDISSVLSFDAKTELPLNRYTYGSYDKLASTFSGTDAPDFGFYNSNMLRIEKRPINAMSNNTYILLIDDITSKQHYEMYALVNATPPYRWVLPDTTLTKANVAADAKATAQAIGAATADCMAQSVAYDYPNNLYDKTTGGTSGYWNGTGYHTTSGSLRITHPIPVKNGVTYIMPFDAGGLGSNNWIAKVDSSGTFISAISGVVADGKLTFTADFNGYVSANIGRLTDDNYYFSALYSREINPLYGKKLSANGDSICAGAGYAGGYAKMIGLRNNMIVQNIAVNGATITTGTKFSDTGENRHWISTSIGDMDADSDYIILEGGINDDANVIGDGKLGALTGAATFTGEFDNTTFCGALEYMFSQAYAHFPGKKIGFIIVHKAAALLNSNGQSASNRYPLIVKACEKWGIPYLDLNTECPPLNYINSLKTAYTNNADGWHPNEAGYAAYYVPKIEAWMKTL